MANENDYFIFRELARYSFIAAILIAILGVVLIYIGDSGEGLIEIFGQSITTSSVGFGALFLSVVLLIVNIRLILRSMILAKQLEQAGPEGWAESQPELFKKMAKRMDSNADF